MSDKLYDLQQLRDLAAGSEDFVQSMIETFLEHTPGQLDEMLAAYDSGDLQSVGSIAHKIKPNIDLFKIWFVAQGVRKTLYAINQLFLRGIPNLNEEVINVI